MAAASGQGGAKRQTGRRFQCGIDLRGRGQSLVKPRTAPTVDTGELAWPTATVAGDGLSILSAGTAEQKLLLRW